MSAMLNVSVKLKVKRFACMTDNMQSVRDYSTLTGLTNQSHDFAKDPVVGTGPLYLGIRQCKAKEPPNRG